MKLATIAKLAKGGFDPDAAQELLASLGFELGMEQVAPGGAEEAFSEAARLTMAAGSELFLVRGKAKDARMAALIVLVPPAAATSPELTGLPNTAIVAVNPT